MVRKYLNYIVFGAVVLLVVGLALHHSRQVHSLVEAMMSDSPQAQSQAADELIKSEQFSDAITGEPVATRVKAAAALEALGNEAAVKQSIPLLKDTDKPVRERAIQALQRIGANAPGNIKALVAGLKDSDPYVRKGTLAALADPQHGIGPKPGVVEAIIDIMKAEGSARSPGGDVLGSPLFDPAARDRSVPRLLAQLVGEHKEKDEGVRQGAAEALGKIGDPQAIAPLKEAMATDTPQVRRVAIGAIALIADPSGEEALVEALNNPNDDNEARAQAIAGLGKIASPSAIAVLVKALDDDDLKLRSAAVAALARASRPRLQAPVTPLVLASLTAALRDSRANVRHNAALALQAVAAPEANAALIAALQQDDAQIRAAAAAALGFPDNQPAIAPLIQALSDPSGAVDTAARDALAAIGPKASEALIAAMQRGGTSAYYAAQAISGFGSAALPALQKAATSVNPVTQRWAAVALGDLLGEHGVAEARPALQQLAQSNDPDVAFVAKEQLNRLRRTQ